MLVRSVDNDESKDIAVRQVGMRNACHVSFNPIRYWVIVASLPSNRKRFSGIKLSSEFTLHPANSRNGISRDREHHLVHRETRTSQQVMAAWKLL